MSAETLTLYRLIDPKGGTDTVLYEDMQFAEDEAKDVGTPMGVEMVEATITKREVVIPVPEDASWRTTGANTIGPTVPVERMEDTLKGLWND